MALISVDNITKTYAMGDVEVRALRGVSLDIEAGRAVRGRTRPRPPGGSGLDSLELDERQPGLRNSLGILCRRRL